MAGIASILPQPTQQGAPATQGMPQRPMPAPPAPAPAVPGAMPAAPLPNNPTAQAAMGLAQSNLAPYNLDPRTEYTTAVMEAKKILDSAENKLKSSYQSPMPPQIAPQVEAEVRQRLGGLNLRSGIAAPNRPAITAMPQTPAQNGGLGGASMPNMMMGGGIVGYADGGYASEMERPVGPTKDMVDPEIEYFLNAYDAYMDALDRGDAVVIARTREVLDSFDPDVRLRAMQLRTRYPKKAMGGEVKRYQAGGLTKEEEDMISEMTGEDVDPILNLQPATNTREEALRRMMEIAGADPVPYEKTELEKAAEKAAMSGLLTDEEMDKKRMAEQAAAELAVGRTQEEKDLAAEIIAAQKAYYGDLSSPEEEKRMRREALMGRLGKFQGATERKIADEQRIRQTMRERRRDATIVPNEKALEYAGIDREARKYGFETGQELWTTLSTRRNQAMQTASQLATNQRNFEQKERLEGMNRAMTALDAQLRNEIELASQGQDNIESLREVRTDYESIRQSIITAFASALASGTYNSPETITALENARNDALADIDAKIEMAENAISGVIGGASAGTPELPDGFQLDTQQ